MPSTARFYTYCTPRSLDEVFRIGIESVVVTAAWNGLFDEVSPEGRLDANQILHRLGAAFDRLPPRCREVVWLRRVEELPQNEVAARLGISQKTVEKQVAKGVRLLAGHFYGNGQAPGPARTREPEIEDEDGHGRQHPRSEAHTSELQSLIPNPA